MNFHPGRNAIRILILFAIAGILVFVYLFSRSPQKTTETSQEISSLSKLAHGKKISFVEYHGDKKVYSVSIDSFSIERAAIGPFAIGPLRIAHLNKVTIDLHLEGIESKLNNGKLNSGKKGNDDKQSNFEIPLSSIRDNLPLPVKKVRGMKLKDLSLSLWRNEERIFKIASETASFDPKTKDVIFKGRVNMDGGKNGTLMSHRVRWDFKERIFKVMDAYVFMKDGEKIEGKRMEVDYLFSKVNHH